MKIALLSAALATASVRALVPYAPPAVINESDCPSAFAMDVRPRRNPGSVGSVTADGYPVLLRPSGTEPLVRVMVEAATQEEADAVAANLADVVKSRLSL